MNARERFLAVMNFERGVRPPYWEFGYWGAAIQRWYSEGLPKVKGLPAGVGRAENVRGESMAWRTEADRDWDVHLYMGFDEGMRRIPLNNFICPPFAEEVLEDHGDWVLKRDPMGIIVRQMKDISSLPGFVQGPVQSREDLERLKEERLRPTLEGRLPEDWPDYVARYRKRDYPLSIMGMAGFYGSPRYLLGDEEVLTCYYDDPELMHAINSHLCDMWIAICEPLIRETKPDLVQMWEDMSYKGGSLISPAAFRAFMLPYYKKLTGFFRDMGVDIVLVDTDGDCWELIPLFVEGGVTGLYPMEVRAGMDVVEVRKAYPKLQILGGLDKTKVAGGKAEIDAELEAKIPPMMEHSGYIPYVDHLVPADVSWENFVYYRKRLAQLVAASTER